MMSVRMFLGQTSGRQLFRIAPPGFDANNLSHPATFSSDGEYLQIHTIIEGQLNRVQYEFQGRAAYDFSGTFGFPELPYPPLVYCTVVHSQTNNRVVFPSDNGEQTPEYRDDFRFSVAKDRLWVATRFPNGFAGQFRIRAIVFKNEGVRSLT